jgi:predicted  nucleic acid-binding Zn-ribbon protein
MPYHKNKQQAFQAAEQGMEQARDIYQQLDSSSSEYGHYLKRLKQEINETEQQIENAHEVASETQRKQLENYQAEIETMKQNLE